MYYIEEVENPQTHDLSSRFKIWELKDKKKNNQRKWKYLKNRVEINQTEWENRKKLKQKVGSKEQ